MAHCSLHGRQDGGAVGFCGHWGGGCVADVFLGVFTVIGFFFRRWLCFTSDAV